MREHKWVRSSLRHLRQRLKQAACAVCPTTLARLLRQAKFSLKANVKRAAGRQHPERNRQFEYLAATRQAFLAAGQPIVSVDTKKKELVGNFKNAGQVWCQEADEVNIHDFPQDALGRAVPYGIYDVTHNQGYVYVGESADTPEFAVTAIATWWEQEGRLLYPHATRLLIVCDAGGSNGCRPRAWKRRQPDVPGQVHWAHARGKQLPLLSLFPAIDIPRNYDCQFVDPTFERKYLLRRIKPNCQECLVAWSKSHPVECPGVND